MAAELSTRLIHEFIAKAAEHIAREQTTDGIIDKQTLCRIQTANESTIRRIAKTLDEIKKVQSGEKIILDLTVAEIKTMKDALTMRTVQTMFNAEVVKKTVTFRKNNIDLIPPFTLDADHMFIVPIHTQLSSIIIECVIFVLRFIGINLQVDTTNFKLANGHATKAVMKSKDLKKDVYQIMADKDDGNAMGKDIFMLVINMFTRNRQDFWNIVKAFPVPIEDDVSQAESLNQWCVIAGQISAFIGMMVATDGTEKIANLTMELGNLEYFKVLLASLKHLREMWKAPDGEP